MIYEHGGDIYTYNDMLDFSVNVNPLGTPERVIAAAKRGVQSAAVYPDSRCRKLREKLSGKQEVSENNYVFGNGAAELIYTLVLAEKPLKALIPVPAFSEYERALQSVGCEIKYFYTKENNYFCIDNNFLNKLEKDVDIVFLCSPVNPSGHKIDKQLLKHAADICEETGTRLVVDECFVDFLQEADNYSMIGETEKYRKLFILRAFTKTYAMAGLRLGYGISSDTDLLERMEQMRQPWSVSVPAQEAGLAALDEEEYVKTARNLIVRERNYLERELNKMGIKFISSDVNFILLYSKIDLFLEMKKQEILIRDCQNYRNLGKGWYRIAVRTHGDNLRLINALADMEVSE